MNPSVSGIGLSTWWWRPPAGTSIILMVHFHSCLILLLPVLLRLNDAQFSADLPGWPTSLLTSFRLCTSRCYHTAVGVCNSHVNAMRCSMFSSHASSASLDGSWRSLNLSVTTGRAAARHQKIWASLTQITEAVIKLCFCTVTLCVLLSYTSMFVQIK